MYYSKSLSFTWNCSPEDKTFTLTEPSSHSVFPTSISLLAFIRAALLNTHFNGLLSNTKSTVWPLLLRAVATVAAAPWRSFSKAHTMFSTSCPSSGNKFFSLSSYVEEGNKGVRYSQAKTELFSLQILVMEKQPETLNLLQQLQHRRNQNHRQECHRLHKWGVTCRISHHHI